MLAVGMERGKTGVHMFKLPMPEIKQPDEVLVQVKEVGSDGTDFGMVRYEQQDRTEDRNEMAMGHEVVGSKVKSLAISDPVTITVPRG